MRSNLFANVIDAQTYKQQHIKKSWRGSPSQALILPPLPPPFALGLITLAILCWNFHHMVYWSYLLAAF